MELEINSNSFVDSATSINTLIIPVGNVSITDFTRFAKFLCEFKSVEAAQLTSELASCNSNLFPKRSWKSDCAIHYNWILPLFLADVTYEPSKWADLKTARRLFGVIGVFHCRAGSASSISDAETLFAAALKRYPTAVAGRCFAFEPFDDQPDLDQAGGDIILIPHCDPTHMAMYLSTLVYDFTNTLLYGIEKWVFDQDKAAYISTPLDSIKTSEEIARLKKRKFGRHAKTKGDVALLLGSPNDAATYFTIAIDHARSSNDAVWLASALEGYAVSCYLIDDEKQTVDQRTHQRVLEKSKEAMGHYQRHLGNEDASFEVELALKMARYHVDIAKDTIEADELLSHAYQRALSLKLSHWDLGTVCESVANLHRQMGHQRKHAFFARECALHWAKQGQTVRAHNLLLSIAPVYQVHLDHHHQQQQQQQWSFLQRILLVDLIATGGHDVARTAQLLVHLLCRVAPGYLPESAQLRYADHLRELTTVLHGVAGGSRISSPMNRLSLDMRGVPLLVKVSVVPLPTSRAPVQQQQQQQQAAAAADNVFITSPFNQKKETVDRRLFVQHEPVTVVVRLSNRLEFELFCESVSLVTRGVPFQAVPVSLELAAAGWVDCQLTGVPLAAGPLEIVGVQIRCFQIDSFHPCPSGGGGGGADDLQLHVTSPLPLLTVQVQQQQQQQQLTVFQGQQLSLRLVFENTGLVPVDQLTSVCVQPKIDEVPHRTLLDVPDPRPQFARILDQPRLPLAPGQRQSIQLQLCVTDPVPHIDILFVYQQQEQQQQQQEMAPQYCRHYLFRIPLQVLRGLEVEKFTVLPGPPATGHRQCIACFDVANHSGLLFSVQPPSAVLVDAHSASRLLIPMPRVWFDVASVPPMRELDRNKKDFDPRLLHLTGAQIEEERVREWYKYRVLVQGLRLDWHALTDPTVRGQLDLTRLSLTPANLTNLQLPPVCVKIDGVVDCVAAGDIELCELRVVLTGAAAGATSATVDVHVYKDFLNGVKLECHDDVIWNGLHQGIDVELQQNECSAVPISFVLQSPGTYTVQTCVTLDERRGHQQQIWSAPVFVTAHDPTTTTTTTTAAAVAVDVPSDGRDERQVFVSPNVDPVVQAKRGSYHHRRTGSTSSLKRKERERGGTVATLIQEEEEDQEKEVGKEKEEKEEEDDDDGNEKGALEEEEKKEDQSVRRRSVKESLKKINFRKIK